MVLIEQAAQKNRSRGHASEPNQRLLSFSLSCVDSAMMGRENLLGDKSQLQRAESEEHEAWTRDGLRREAQLSTLLTSAILLYFL